MSQSRIVQDIENGYKSTENESIPLISRMRGNGDSLASICGTLCCGLIIGGVIFICFNIFSIGAIIAGALHLHDCPIEPHLPTMMIAMGTILCLVSLADSLGYGKNLQLSKVLGQILKIVQFCLFVYMCVLLYRSYSDVVYVKGSSNYCSKSLYLFAYWFVVINLLAVVISIAMVYFLGSQESSKE